MSEILEQLLRNVSSVSAKTLEDVEKHYVISQVGGRDADRAQAHALADLIRYEPDS